MSTGRSVTARSVAATSIVVALACLFAFTGAAYADMVIGPEPSPSPTPSPSRDSSQTTAATAASGSGGTGDLAVRAGAGVAVVAVAAGAVIGLRRLTAARATPAGPHDEGACGRPDGEAGA